MTVLDDLLQFGYQPVTEWVMKNEKVRPASFTWKDYDGWLYAFVVDGEVRYIGLTDRVLRSRMSDYTHMKHTQTARLRGLIAAELEAGRRVQVFGWKQNSKAVLFAEEERLRAKYRPPWNRI